MKTHNALNDFTEADIAKRNWIELQEADYRHKCEQKQPMFTTYEQRVKYDRFAMVLLLIIVICVAIMTS